MTFKKAIAHEFADLALLKFDERRLNRKINQAPVLILL